MSSHLLFVSSRVASCEWNARLSSGRLLRTSRADCLGCFPERSRFHCMHQAWKLHEADLNGRPTLGNTFSDVYNHTKG